MLRTSDDAKTFCEIEKFFNNKTMGETNIVDLTGKTKKIACLGCDREKGLIDLGDIVIATLHVA
jgi:hypothetical protein